MDAKTKQIKLEIAALRAALREIAESASYASREVIQFTAEQALKGKD